MLLPRAARLLLLALALLALAPAGRAASGSGSGSGSAPAKKKAKPPPEPEGVPADAVRVHLEVGQTFALSIPGGTQVVCDNPAVAKSDFTAEAIVLSAQGPGATLCGARLAGAPKGLWYVVVEGK